MFSHSIIINILRYYFVVYGNIYAVEFCQWINVIISVFSEIRSSSVHHMVSNQYWDEIFLYPERMSFVFQSTKILTFSFTSSRLAVAWLDDSHDAFCYFTVLVIRVCFIFTLAWIQYGFEQHYINTTTEELFTLEQKRVLKNVELCSEMKKWIEKKQSFEGEWKYLEKTNYLCLINLKPVSRRLFFQHSKQRLQISRAPKPWRIASNLTFLRSQITSEMN